VTERLVITTEGPLSLPAGRQTGFSVDTLFHIPGTVLRGALAQAYLEAGGDTNDATFEACFGSAGIRFTDLRPAGAFPWPMSLRECAEYPGIHPRVDLLLPLSRGASLLGSCGVCQAKLLPLTGFGKAVRNAVQPYVTEKVVVDRRMHSAIDPHTLRVIPEKFHSARTLAAQQTFTGKLWAAAAAEAEWPKLLAKLVDVGTRDSEGRVTLFLGRGRSRGQGRVTLKLVSGARESGMQQRLVEFNELAGSPISFAFSCDFRSTALFYDPWLRSKTRLEGEDLHPELVDYRAVATFARTAARSGWHAAAQLPKPETPLLDRGACYLFQRRLPEGVSVMQEIERLAPTLEKLEATGTGERLSEGWGEVEFCHPIHLAE